MTATYKNIGKKLKRARELCDFTQEQVGSYLGVKREMISYLENGTRPISLAQLTKMADLYGYDINHFVGEDPGEPALMSFRAANIENEDMDTIAQIKRFANNLHFLNSLLEGKGMEL